MCGCYELLAEQTGRAPQPSRPCAPAGLHLLSAGVGSYWKLLLIQNCYDKEDGVVARCVGGCAIVCKLLALGVAQARRQKVLVARI